MAGSIQAPPFTNFGYDPTTHLYLPIACTPMLTDATNNEEYALAMNVNVSNGNANGQSTMVGSSPVAIASDQTPIPIKMVSATGTPTSVNAANSDTSLLASNVNRLGAYFFNDSTAILYLLLSSGTSSTTNYTVQIQPGGFYEVPTLPTYQGAIKGTWSAANGAVRITEMS